MGNNIKERISISLAEMKDLINNLEYEKSYKKYLIIRKELAEIKKENTIFDISNHLLKNEVHYKDLSEFQTLIENLLPKDKLCYLFQLIYENELIKAIFKNIPNNDREPKIKDELIKNKNNLEKSKEEINNLKERINKIDKYIKFIRFKSIIFEKIAEINYNLGVKAYSDYGNNNKTNIDELQEIIDFFQDCVENYEKTENQKIKMKEYLNSLERVKAHKNILLGKEKLTEENYEEALNYFNKVNFNNAILIEEKNNGTHLCYEKLSKIKEEEKNYPKAIEYYKLLNNYLKIYELEIRINENEIIEKIKEKKFDETLVYFGKIFELLAKAKEREFIELKFSNLFFIFIELIIKLAIISYQQKSLLMYINTLEDIKDGIDNNDISSKIKELITELNNLEKDEKNLFFEHIQKTLNSDTSEIKQRFYLSLLIIKYLKEKPLETLTILLRREIKLSYLTSESFGVLKDYFKINENVDYLLLISKLFYKVIVSLGIFHRIDNLNMIQEKINKIIKYPEFEANNKYNDIIEYLILSYQEILINNQKINKDKYNGPKKFLFYLIQKNDKYINQISRSLLFLSSKGIKFEKKEINIITSYLINNENDNMLQSLIIQYEIKKEFNEEITEENLDSIYKIIFNYQKIKNEKIERIFNFLLSLPENLISSRISILNLEEYIKKENAHPLCYKLIKKIPIKRRSIKLSQKLTSFNDKDKNIQINLKEEDIKNKYNMMSVISKDDLPNFEKNLEEKFYVERLVFYLKNQTDLFNYLNLAEICKHFSNLTKELFNILIENEVKFNEIALLNLLSGFYTGDEELIKQTFDIFNKIKQYHDNFPFIIEINLKIEEFLEKQQYKEVKSYDIKLNEIFNDFSYLNGFSNQHRDYIIYLLKLSSSDKRKEILDKMTSLLVQKNYDIGKEIHKEILEDISLDGFIKIIPVIFSTKKISSEIKNITINKLYNFLNKIENKTGLIKSFKLFVDFIYLPNKMLEYLITLLKEKINDEIYKEIIFFLGNYFSTGKKKEKQEKYLNKIIDISSKDEIYKFILNNVKSVKLKNEIFYLYGCLIYQKFNDFSQEEKYVLKIPTNNIADIMEILNDKLDKRLFFENLAYLNNHFKYKDFSPNRDMILRRIYFNHKKNSLNKIKLICC